MYNIQLWHTYPPQLAQGPQPPGIKSSVARLSGVACSFCGPSPTQMTQNSDGDNDGGGGSDVEGGSTAASVGTGVDGG